MVQIDEENLHKLFELAESIEFVNDMTSDQLKTTVRVLLEAIDQVKPE